MALEDLVGPDKFLDALVISNPTATDPVEEGDDHIRGVKNVSVNSFGAMTGLMEFVAGTPIDIPDLITGTPGGDLLLQGAGGSVTIGDTLDVGGNVTLDNLDVAGVIKVADAAGTALLPHYAFSPDDNTGMFRAGADLLGFATAGLERMRVDASGNVGIGTTTPTGLLHVAGMTGLVTGLVMEAAGNDADTRVLDVLNSAPEFRMGVEYDSPAPGLHVTDRARARLFSIIEATGNVGIGTTTPQTLLHLAGGAVDVLIATEDANRRWEFGVENATQDFVIRDATSGNTNFRYGAGVTSELTIGAASMRWIGGIPSSSNTLRIADPSEVFEAEFGVDAGGGGGTFVGARTNQPLSFRVNNSERMRISEAGFLGIGTTTPDEPLHVNGNTLIPENFARIFDLAKTTTIRRSSALGSMIFQTNSLDQMFLRDSGNFGIGESNPAFPLDVAGDINTSGAYRIDGGFYTASGRGTLTSGTLAVSFGKTFPSVPVVVATYNESAEPDDKLRVSAITTTGCTINGSLGTFDVDWIAMVVN